MPGDLIRIVTLFAVMPLVQDWFSVEFSNREIDRLKGPWVLVSVERAGNRVPPAQFAGERWTFSSHDELTFHPRNGKRSYSRGVIRSLEKRNPSPFYDSIDVDFHRPHKAKINSSHPMVSNRAFFGIKPLAGPGAMEVGLCKAGDAWTSGNGVEFASLTFGPTHTCLYRLQGDRLKVRFSQSETVPPQRNRTDAFVTKRGDQDNIVFTLKRATR